MARDAIPVVKQLHGDLYAEVATPDPTFTGEANPASIMHVCVGDWQTLVIVGVRPWHDQLHAVTVTEEGDEVQIAAWTTHRATAQSDADDDPFGAVARSLLWAAVISLRRPLGGRRVAAALSLAPSRPPPDIAR